MTRTIPELDRALVDVRAKVDVIQTEIEAIHDRHRGTVRDGRYLDGPPMTSGERERVANLQRGLDRLGAQEEEIADERRAIITPTPMAALARGGDVTMSGFSPPPTTRTTYD